jgi:tetratricopeptide (TPR) repeat protein
MLAELTLYIALQGDITSAGSATTHAREAQDSAERLRAYLERNPYHARVFDDLVADAELAGEGLAGLVREHEARVAAEPDVLAPRVLLARLVARQGDIARAQGLLVEALAGLASAADHASAQALAPQRVSLERLLAALELEAGDVDAARTRLARLVAEASASPVASVPDARSLTTLLERDVHEALLDELAEAHDLAGDADGVRTALAALADLVGDDVAGLVVVAARCEQHGLVAEAELALRSAVELAVDDPARRCNALGALGKLLESTRRGEEALAVYDEVLGLLAAGHWLRNDVLDRAIELRIGAGNLQTWLDTRRSDSAEDTRTVALDTVRALERTGHGAEAAALLAELAATRPNDQELAERFVSAARAADRLDLALDVLQRRAAATPTGPGAARLQLELAEALTETGALDGARLALQRAASTAQAASDSGSLLTVAHRYAVLGDRAAAYATLESAAALDPTSPTALLELAALAHQIDDQASRALHADALERASTRASGSDRVGVAEVWLERGDMARGVALLEAALDDPSTRPFALERLARHYAALADASPDAPPDAVPAAGSTPARDPESAVQLTRARELWMTLACEAHGIARVSALEAYLATYSSEAGRRALLSRVRAGEIPNEAVTALLAASLSTRLDQHADAAAEYARVIALEPENLAAREARVRALGRAKDIAGALQELDELLLRDPRRRTELLLERAKLLIDARRVNDAHDALAQVAAAARRSPDALREVSALYRATGNLQPAARTLARALRLDPTDTRMARQLAQLEAQLGRRTEACERFATTWAMTDDPGEQAGLLRELEQTLGTGPQRDEYFDTLVQRVRDNRYDRASLELALALLPRARRFSDVGAIAELVLLRAPDDPRGLAARSIARAAAADVPGTLADVQQRVARGEGIDEVLMSLLAALRASDDGALAEALGALAVDIDPLATALLTPGYDRLTVRFLRGHVAQKGFEANGVLDRLAQLDGALDPPEFALEVYHALEARDGVTIVRVHRMGKLQYKLGDRDGCLARGKQLIELGAPGRMVESYFTSSDLRAEYEALLAAAPSDGVPR